MDQQAEARKAQVRNKINLLKNHKNLHLRFSKMSLVYLILTQVHRDHVKILSLNFYFKNESKQRYVVRKVIEYVGADLSRIIEMAWEDRTPFEAIQREFGLNETAVIRLMRKNMKASEF